jgi:DNA-binding NarL/FixJ family response regulator
MSIRIFVIDDNKDRRESLQYLISMYADLELAGMAANGENIVEKIAEASPNVVLMDIDMPVVNGIEATRLIKATFPEVIVMMQTVFEDDEKVFESIKSGASGYLLKKTSPERIIEAIRDVAEGGSPMSPVVAAKVLQFFQQSVPKNEYALTEREKSILSLLVEGLSYKMIASNENISYHTVNSHIRKIYEKLHVHSIGEAISKALKEKLI